MVERTLVELREVLISPHRMITTQLSDEYGTFSTCLDFDPDRNLSMISGVLSLVMMSCV